MHPFGGLEPWKKLHRNTGICKKMVKDRIASFRDHRAEPQKKLLRNTVLPDHLFAGNHHVRSDTPGAVAQSVLKSYLKVEHQSRAQNYVNPDVLPVLPKTPVVWQHKLK